MTDIRRVGDAGVHTVEGTVAGSRAARMTKQREQERMEYEAVKNKIKQDNAAKVVTSSTVFTVLDIVVSIKYTTFACS